MTTLEASDFFVLILAGNKNILIPLMRSFGSQAKYICKAVSGTLGHFLYKILL